jgi:hypothetical protein
MATGAQATARLAGETGSMWSRLERAAVALQAAGKWPKGSRGGGRATPHVEPEHLVNLMLAIACADPITAAAGAVHRFRSLIVSRTVEVQEVEIRGDGGVITRLTPEPARRSAAEAALHQFGNTFGARCDGLLLLASRDRLVRDFAWGAVSFTFTLDDEFPEAALTFSNSIGTDRMRRTIETSRFRIAHDEDMPQRQTPAAAPVRTVTVPFAFFEVLRDLAHDTLQKTAEDPKLCVVSDSPA